MQLSLVGMEPITVDCGDGPQDWDVAVSLSANQPPGQMQIRQTDPNGGTFNSILPVVPLFTFTNIGTGATRTFDAAALPPFVLNGLFFNALNTPYRAPGGCIDPALHLDPFFCPSQTPQGQKVLTIEQALLARHGIYPAQPGLEHFKCYKLKKRKFKKRSVSLEDQFGSRKTKVKKRLELCNPVQKNGETFLNELAHLPPTSSGARSPG